MEKRSDELPQKSTNREKRRIVKKRKERVFKKKDAGEEKYSQDKNITINKETKDSDKEWDFIMDELKQRRDEEIADTNSQNLDAKETASGLRFIELGHKKEILDARRKYDMEKVLNANLNENDRHAQIELIEAEYSKNYANLEVVAKKENEFPTRELDSLNKDLAKGLIEFNNEYDELIKKEDSNIEDAEQRDSQIKSDEEIKNLIEETRVDLDGAFNNIRIKFSKFSKKYSDSEDLKDKHFIVKLEELINRYAKRIKEFDDLSSYSREKWSKMNQLHNELQEWSERDWIELYEERIKKINSENIDTDKKENEPVENIDRDPITENTENALLELEHKDLHGTEINKIEDKNEPIVHDSALSEAERMELASLIEEKLADVNSDYALVLKKFHDFRESNKEAVDFNKIIFRKIAAVDEKRSQLRKIVKQAVSLNQEVLNDLIDLDEEIIILTREDWREELEKNSGDILRLSEKEKNIVEKSKEVVNKYIKKAKTKFPWDDFPKGRIDELLEIQAMAFLMQEFKKRSLFIDRAEDIAELIIKNRK